MLSLENIKKQFGNEIVLNGVNAQFDCGLNFIIGPSGCGKSTLLKIISGMDHDFTGDLLFHDKSLKDFNRQDMTNFYYSSIGFVWQNFQLVNHLTVEDNIKLISNLLPVSCGEKEKRLQETLKKLGIQKLANVKVGKLSGGQKQRVAIARAIIKDPDVIIADEPTGALDAESSKSIMNELRKIAKNKLVIIVTHDKSLIDHNCSCFVLKNGKLEVLKQSNTCVPPGFKRKINKPSLGGKDTIIQAGKNIRGLSLKFLLSGVVLILSSFLLLLNFSGEIQNVQDEIYNELVDERGEGIRDIRLLTDSLSSGGDFDGQQLTQDVYEVFDLLKDDDRIEFMYTREPVWDITVDIEDLVSDYNPKSSRIAPSIQKLAAGKMAAPDQQEIVIPQTLLDKFHLTADEVIGKKLDYSGVIRKRSMDSEKRVSLNDLTIVGVADTRFYNQVDLDDCFILSVNATKDILEQAGIDLSSLDAIIRVKSLDDMLDVVDDLQMAGYVPQGDFSMIEDMLKLKSTNESQGSLVSTILFVLSVVTGVSLTIINTYLRKSEYAILKMNGYSSSNLLKITLMEYVELSLLSSIAFAVMMPLLNLISSRTLELSISSFRALVLGCGITMMQGVLIGLVSSVISSKFKPLKNMKSGEVQ